MKIIKLLNLLVRFLLELCLLAVFGYWGWKTATGTAPKIGLAMSSPLLAAIIWGIFVAPGSSRRLQNKGLLIAELLLFGLACIALYSTGQRVLALAFGVIYFFNKGLMHLWRQ